MNGDGEGGDVDDAGNGDNGTNLFSFCAPGMLGTAVIRTLGLFVIRRKHRLGE